MNTFDLWNRQIVAIKSVRVYNLSDNPNNNYRVEEIASVAFINLNLDKLALPINIWQTVAVAVGVA